MGVHKELCNAFSFSIVEGVQCIVFNFDPLSYNKEAAKKDTRARGKAKDIIGNNHKDVLMLDSKEVDGSSEFCDAIVISDELDSWDKSIKKFYEKDGYTVENHTLPYGYQNYPRCAQ